MGDTFGPNGLSIGSSLHVSSSPNRHYVIFPMAEVAVPKELFQEILRTGPSVGSRRSDASSPGEEYVGMTRKRAKSMDQTLSGTLGTTETPRAPRSPPMATGEPSHLLSS